MARKSEKRHSAGMGAKFGESSVAEYCLVNVWLMVEKSFIGPFPCHLALLGSGRFSWPSSKSRSDFPANSETKTLNLVEFRQAAGRVGGPQRLALRSRLP